MFVCTCVIYFLANVSKRNICEPLHRSAQQPLPLHASGATFAQFCVFFFLLQFGQMGCSIFKQSTHQSRLAHIPTTEIHEYCRTSGGHGSEDKKGQQIATHTLTSPISYHIITISIHPTINPRFQADSRWFKILSQTHVMRHSSGKAQTHCVKGSTMTTVAHSRGGTYCYNCDK